MQYGLISKRKEGKKQIVHTQERCVCSGDGVNLLKTVTESTRSTLSIASSTCHFDRILVSFTVRTVNHMHVYLVPLIKVHLRLCSPLVALNRFFGEVRGNFVIFSAAVSSVVN